MTSFKFFTLCTDEKKGVNYLSQGLYTIEKCFKKILYPENLITIGEWVNPVLNTVVVNSLRLGGLQLYSLKKMSDFGIPLT